MMLHSHSVDMADAGLRHGKRKAAEAPDGNERLSKRMGLLQIDNSGSRSYKPVFSSSTPAASRPPQVQAPTMMGAPPQPPQLSQYTRPHAHPLGLASSTPTPTPAPVRSRPSHPPPDDAAMDVEDSKYKIYIHNMDDELSADEDAADDGLDSVAVRDDAGHVTFLPAVEQHLRAAARSAALGSSGSVAPTPKLAVPRPVRPNQDGELAGMQVVLYSDPSSLSVPREHDSVRQAILDVRARFRERRQEAERRRASDALPLAGVDDNDMAEPVPAADDAMVLD